MKGQPSIQQDLELQSVPGQQEAFHGLKLSDNRNFRFLPENPAESFPNLVAYGARFCSIEPISKVNFENLDKLQFLDF